MQFPTAEVEIACLMTDSFRRLGAQAEGRLDYDVIGKYRGRAFVRHATVEGEETEAGGSRELCSVKARSSILARKTCEYVLDGTNGSRVLNDDCLTSIIEERQPLRMGG